MIHAFAGALLSLALVSHAPYALASDTSSGPRVCTGSLIESPSAPRFDYHYDDRHIIVLGWQHPMERGTSDDFATYEAIKTSAQSFGGCPAVNSQLQKFIASKAQDAPERERIKGLLQTYSKQYALKTVGIEFSQSDVDDAQKHLEMFKTDSALITAGCPQSSDLIDKANFAVLGPEFDLTLKSNGKLTLVGDDDADLKAKSLGPTQIIQDPSLRSALKAASLMELQVLAGKIQNGLNPISQKEIDDFAKTLSDSQDRSAFEKIAGAFKSLSDLARQRNDVIIRNILARPGDHVLVLGSAHVAGLYNLLKNKCESDENSLTNPNSPTSPAAAPVAH